MEGRMTRLDIIKSLTECGMKLKAPDKFSTDPIYELTDSLDQVTFMRQCLSWIGGVSVDTLGNSVRKIEIEGKYEKASSEVLMLFSQTLPTLSLTETKDDTCIVTTSFPVKMLSYFYTGNIDSNPACFTDQLNYDDIVSAFIQAVNHNGSVLTMSIVEVKDANAICDFYNLNVLLNTTIMSYKGVVRMTKAFQQKL